MMTEVSDSNFSNFAIVILNWNGRSVLEEFLPSVIKYSGNAVIYIIDNASTDDSVIWLKKNYPTIKIVKLQLNTGYAGGYQEGLKVIHEPFYCLLNNDVEVTENWLNPIKSLFDLDKKIAAIQPKILDQKKPTHFEYAGAGGGFIDKFGYPYCRGRIFKSIEKDNDQYNDELPIFWASGACFFIRKNDFWNAGGFDIDYFAHQEEVDLCWRLYNLEKKVFYSGKSKVYHVGGTSLSYDNPKKVFLNFRNSLYSILKNHSGISVIYILFIRMLLDGIAGFKFLFERKIHHFFAIIKAHLYFYYNFPKFLKKRIQSTQKKRNYTIKSIVYKYYISNKQHY